MSDGSNGSAITVIEPMSSLEANVGVLMRRATDVAGVCQQIVAKTAQEIQGRKYVRVEGWQAIAVAYGCVASSRDVEVVDSGIRAIGEVRRMSDGVVISTAEGFVGNDEPKWAKNPEYARRAMAQTRAVSRACRGAFSFVVTLIDGGFETTPLEEAEDIVPAGSTTPPPPAIKGTAALKQAMRPSPPRSNEPPPPTDADFRPVEQAPAAQGGYDRSFVMPFANKKNEPLSELSEKNLIWFRKALNENINDPSKARFRETAEKHLGLIEAEMRFRGL